MNVSIIEPVGGHGGMDYYDFGLCNGLLAAGVDVALFTSDETAIPHDTKFLIRNTYIGIYGDTSFWIRGLRYLRGTFSSIFLSWKEKRRICHFHFFQIGFLELINIIIAKVFRSHIVITAHDVESFHKKKDKLILIRWAYRQADCVIAHNFASRQELINKNCLPDKKISVIPHGNYLHAIRTTPPQKYSREFFGINKSAKVILFFGQIKEVKGLDLLLEAFPEILKAHPNTKLLIAGRPWKNDFLKYKLAMKNYGVLEHCVCHIRHIDDAEVPLFFSAADVVVLPYRRIYQSGVVLMAMSYAKMVLVSNLPGMTEIVKNNENGLVFSQMKVNSLVESLKLSLADEKLRKRLAINGYNYVKKYNDWNLIGEKTKKVYMALLNKQ